MNNKVVVPIACPKEKTGEVHDQSLYQSHACLIEDIYRAVGTIALEGLSFGIIAVDHELRIIHWNGWMEKHSGIREKDLIGCALPERFPEIKERGKDVHVQYCVEQRRTVLLSPLLHEFLIPLPIVRERRTIRMRQNVKIYPFLHNRTGADKKTESGQTGAIIIIQDMTESMFHEMEIRRLNSLLDGIRNVNKLMVRVDTEPELLQGACDILVNSIGCRLAWIGLWSRNGKGLGAVASSPRPSSNSILLSRCGADCVVVETGTHHILEPENGERFERACLSSDITGSIRRVCCMPLISENRHVGVLHILTEDPAAFHSDELQLLEEYASDIAYALDRLQDRRRRKAAESALRENENRLRQSQKMEAIGVLAGGIAHDFNNILYPIIGFSEIIRDHTRANAPEREFVDEVLKAACRARDLVQQILAFSRQSDQTKESVRLGPIVKETLQLMRASLPSSIEIRTDIQPDCGPVLADPTHIYQVIMNLCTNAFQAMENTGGRLDIVLGEQNPPGMPVNGDQAFPAFVKLSVSDTGDGMESAVRDRIFEPYYTTKEQGKGTGMGLSVVHGIVEGMGGRIEVNTAPGQGARFDLYLPVHYEAADPEEGGGIPDALPIRSVNGEHILAVDDEIQNLNMIKTALNALGYSVTVISDSREALRRFSARPDEFDLVITDLTMPGVSGNELAREMTRMRPDLPVILCTGNKERISKDEARAAGIRRLLDKPMGNRLLAKTVRDALDGSKE